MQSISKLHVVLGQINVIFGKPEENFSHIEQKIKDVDFSNKDTLLIFPELFATGYDLEAIKNNAETLEKSKIVKFCKDIASQKKTFLYTSVPELFNNKVYNTGIFIDPSGTIKASYRKIHLFRPLQEHVAFSPGETVTTLNSNLGPIGFSICYDLRFAEVYVKQRNSGTKIFLICAEWPIPRINHWTTLIQARAIEHQSMIIAVNRVGTDPTGTYGGNSLIVTADGTILYQGTTEESVAEIDIDLSEKLNIPSLFSIVQEKRVS